MTHVIAPERALRPAKQPGPLHSRGKQQAGCLQPAAGEHDCAAPQVDPLARLQGHRNPARASGYRIDVKPGRDRAQHDPQSRIGGEPRGVQLPQVARLAPPFKPVEAASRGVRDARDGRAEPHRPGIEVERRALVPRPDIVCGNRPAAGGGPAGA